MSAFFTITFLYSWAVFALMFVLIGGEQIGESRLWQIPFAWGPLLAALLVGQLSTGDVRPWLRTVGDPRTNPKWYLIAAVVVFLYADAPHVLGSLLGVPVALDHVEEIAVSFGVTLLFAGSLEEFGWRGFAQPRLQERYDALIAAIMIGILVGVWHYPWLLLAGAGYENAGLGALVALPLVMTLMAIVFAWLFNGSGGTIPVVMLGHAVFNATPAFEFTADAPSWLSAVGLLVWLGLIVMVVVVYGRNYLAPTGPPPAVVGEAD
ncbi:CPBP family intramembrane glutamic endopeptidase [Natronobacterium haloterrestre]|uniref:CPBP family intramembrane glutamic endopeptidase n=1 Tax=Natronobacterium haloterrestre TaxID=148448 RepID=UPI0015A57FFB|nr:CPBP family intramembrane glutamic endopeptidase [Halobiforma haloterrestris]